jgi:hypothetical protein
VYDPTLRVNRVANWPVKSVTDNYLYTIDWSFYAATDPIVASSWVLGSGLLSWSESFTGVVTKNFVGFGKDRTVCNLVNTVTLVSNIQYTQLVKLRIDNQICLPRPTHGLGGAELACQEI